jgi:transposase-like protein
MALFLGLDEGRHFDRELIVLSVRWYPWSRLSYRDLVEMMAERRLSWVHIIITRWVNHYAPEFKWRWNRFARPAGSFGASMKPTSRSAENGCTYTGQSTAEPWTSG